jgi:hypothetical protein
MAEETTLYIPVGLEAVLASASTSRDLAASLDPAQPVVAAVKRAHGEALAREVALGSTGRMAWLLRVELLTFVLQKREPRVEGRGDALELHVAPGDWAGYGTTLQQKQVELAYYRADFEPPQIGDRPAEVLLARILRVRASTLMEWMGRAGARLYPTLSWWRCTGATTPRELEWLEIAWNKAHPDRPLPARCAVVYR